MDIAHVRSEDGRGRGLGWYYVHVAVDDHSRLAHAAVLADEKATTCAQFLHRAVAWFRQHGIIVQRMLTDNAKAYRTSHDWAVVCAALQIKRRFTCVRTGPRPVQAGTIPAVVELGGPRAPHSPQVHAEVIGHVGCSSRRSPSWYGRGL